MILIMKISQRCTAVVRLSKVIEQRYVFSLPYSNIIIIIICRQFEWQTDILELLNWSKAWRLRFVFLFLFVNAFASGWSSSRQSLAIRSTQNWHSVVNGHRRTCGITKWNAFCSWRVTRIVRFIFFWSDSIIISHLWHDKMFFDWAAPPSPLLRSCRSLFTNYSLKVRVMPMPSC